MPSSRSVGRAAAPLFLTATLLFAGEPAVQSGDSGHKKCPYATQDCLNHMASRMKASGWIGVEYDLDAKTDLYTVQRVVPGSPAEKAGIQSGDVLFALNGVEIKKDNDEALMKARKEWKPGQTVTYTIKRGGAAKQIDVVLGEWPADLLARYIGEHMLEHAEADAAAAPKAPQK